MLFKLGASVDYWPFQKFGFGLNSRLRLAWPGVDSTFALCSAYALRDSDMRMEPEAESKAEAMDSKRAYESKIFPNSGKGLDF